MGAPLKSLTIQGFKSIRNLEDFQLDKLNVLIGANGSGKSNFLELFRLLSAMTREDGLREYVEGAGDDYLFGGPKVTEKIVVKMLFGQNGYDFELTSTPQGFLMIRNETTHYFGHGGVTTKRIGGGSFDSALLTARKESRGFFGNTARLITSTSRLNLGKPIISTTRAKNRRCVVTTILSF